MAAWREPAPAAAGSHKLEVRKPKCDLRQYRAVKLGNGTRLLLVSDPEATFAAACANVRAGYFDDPETVPGLAHFLEHAVHLGSDKYPDPKAYKSFLAQHGGTSNASTSMVHTSFHFKVHHQYLEGALDRFAQFFISPLLLQEAALAEVENVHAEYSRNCNSDDRKLLQLRRSTMGLPYSKFSTGNVTTLRDAPLQAGLQVQELLRQYWTRRYTGDALCCCIVSPHDLDQLEAWASNSFADMRPTYSPSLPSTAIGKGSTSELNGTPPGTAIASKPAALLSQWQDWPLDFTQISSADQLGLMFRVRPQRELRELEVRWYIPYGSMQDVRCKPWRWVGHLLGHEAVGSLAYSLKQAELVQSLVTGMGDEVRLGRGFMFWGVTVSLTEKGLQHEQLILELIFDALRVIKQVPDVKRQEIYQELQQLSELNFNYQDRQQPLDLAKDAANRLHYFDAEELLSGPVLLQVYDGAAVDRFLSHLVPETMNVYFSSQHHPAEATPLTERWYGAKYGVQPLGQEMLARLRRRLDAPADASIAAASPEASPGTSLPQLQPLHLPADNWALPVSTELCQAEPPTWGAGGQDPPEQQVGGTDCLPTTAGRGNGQANSSIRQRPTGPPQLVASLQGLQAWHQTDVSLELPKAYVSLHLITPEAYRTPRHWVLARLYCRLLNDLLEPQAYYAQLAGSSYSLSCSETGLVLQLQGYSSVVKKLLGVVLEGMNGAILDVEHVRRRFSVHEGQLRQSWQVWKHNNPLSHAEYHTDLALQVPHWHVTKDGLSLLEQGLVGPADVVAWAAALVDGSKLHINMLVYGNVDITDTQGIISQVESRLRPNGIPQDQWPQPEVLRLKLKAGSSTLQGTGLAQADDDHGQGGGTAESPNGVLQEGQERGACNGEEAGSASAAGERGLQPLRVTFVPDNPNPGNSNSAAYYLCQVGEGAPWDVRLSVLLELLVQVAAKPCFHSLRTVQRLGYVAGCQLHRLEGILGFAVRVQSHTYPAAHVHQRIAHWLVDFRAELGQLPQERLQHFKDALWERYNEPPKSLSEAASQAWLPIRRGTLDFDTRAVKASLINQVTLQELLAFYDRYILPTGADHCSLCCEVQGGMAKPSTDQEHLLTHTSQEQNVGLGTGATYVKLLISDVSLAEGLKQQLHPYTSRRTVVTTVQSQVQLSL